MKIERAQKKVQSACVSSVVHRCEVRAVIRARAVGEGAEVHRIKVA